MKRSDFDEILQEYGLRKKAGNIYLLFETHFKWFNENADNGNLKAVLLSLLKESYQSKNILKYELVVLIIQAFSIPFNQNEEHFDFLFLITDGILENLNLDNNAWILNQFADICFHHSAEVKMVAQREPDLILSVIKKIGTTKYETSKVGPEMYFATYKSVGLIWFLNKKNAKRLLENVFLVHFDERVIDEAEELVEQLKEEKRY